MVVQFSEPVFVTGTPTLTLETGENDAVVNYSGGSGTNSLTFNYTVGAGHQTNSLDYTSTSPLSLNGGTITDAAGNNANLTLATPGNPGSLNELHVVVTPSIVLSPTVRLPEHCGGKQFAGSKLYGNWNKHADERNDERSDPGHFSPRHPDLN